MSKKKSRPRARDTATSPARHLEAELLRLRSELRQTVRSYSARLEVELAQSLAAIKASAPPEELPRERLHLLRDLIAMLRKRKLKPEKGRRKDLRKIDALINDVHSSLPEAAEK